MSAVTITVMMLLWRIAVKTRMRENGSISHYRQNWNKNMALNFAYIIEISHLAMILLTTLFKR